MVTKLRKLEPIIMNKTLIRVQTMHFGRTMILNFSDGSVEYRDRFTCEELYNTEDLNQITHLRQVGWEFPEGNTSTFVFPG
jgi:mediator of RNA polymerase II transcription subunit 16